MLEILGVRLWPEVVSQTSTISVSYRENRLYNPLVSAATGTLSSHSKIFNKAKFDSAQHIAKTQVCDFN